MAINFNILRHFFVGLQRYKLPITIASQNINKRFDQRQITMNITFMRFATGQEIAASKSVVAVNT